MENIYASITDNNKRSFKLGYTEEGLKENWNVFEKLSEDRINY